MDFEIMTAMATISSLAMIGVSGVGFYLMSQSRDVVVVGAALLLGSVFFMLANIFIMLLALVNLQPA